MRKLKVTAAICCAVQGMLAMPLHATANPERQRVPLEIAYEAFLGLLSATADSNRHGYLHILGDAFDVQVDIADPESLQTLRSRGAAFLNHFRSLEAAQASIGHTLLCTRHSPDYSVAEHRFRLGLADARIRQSRKAHMRRSLGSLPPADRRQLVRFLKQLAPGIGYAKSSTDWQLADDETAAREAERLCDSIKKGARHAAQGGEEE